MNIECSACNDQYKDIRCTLVVDFNENPFGKVCMFCLPLVRRNLNCLALLHGGVVEEGKLTVQPTGTPVISSCAQLTELTAKVRPFTPAGNFGKIREFFNYWGLSFTERAPGVFALKTTEVRAVEEMGRGPVRPLSATLLQSFPDINVNLSVEPDVELFTIKYRVGSLAPVDISKIVTRSAKMEVAA